MSHISFLRQCNFKEVTCALVFLFSLVSACGKKGEITSQYKQTEKGAKVAANADKATPGSLPLHQQVESFFTTYCVSCHGENGSSQGGFSSAGSLSLMTEQGYVVPEKPEESPVYTKTLANMPPAESPQPTEQEKDILKKWIEEGASTGDSSSSRSQLSLTDDIIQVVEEDLASLSADQKLQARYITLWPAWNMGQTEEQVETLRQGLIKLLNSLSRSASLIKPPALDQERSLFRVLLSDFGWNSATWDIASEGEVFFQDHPELVSLRQLTGSPLPIVRAEHFIAMNSVAPRYYQIQALPLSLDEMLNLELKKKPLTQLYSDFLDGTQSISRLAFNDSQVTEFSRVIERFAANDKNQRPFWLSHEFDSGDPIENPFQAPFGPPALQVSMGLGGSLAGRQGVQSPQVEPGQSAGFQPQAHEMIFTKANGMLGFYVALSNGQRLDIAPSTVRDSSNESTTIRVGSTCMSCHGDGVLSKDDQLLSAFDTSPLDNAHDAETLKRLYARPEATAPLFEADRSAYQSALKQIGVDPTRADPVNQIRTRFIREVRRAEVEVLLGCAGEQFIACFDRLPENIRVKWTALRIEDGSMQREAFEEDLERARKALEGSLTDEEDLDAGSQESPQRLDPNLLRRLSPDDLRELQRLCQNPQTCPL